MKKMPTTKLEILEGLMIDLEKCRKECSEKYKSIDKDDFNLLNSLEVYIQSKMRRFIKKLDIRDWNFNCYNQRLDLSKEFFWIEEDFDIIEDEIKEQYAFYYKESENMKIDIFLEMARGEARQEQNTEVLQELETMTSSEIIADNGHRFKSVMKKITTPIAKGLIDGIEGFIKAGTAGVTSAVLTHMGV